MMTENENLTNNPENGTEPENSSAAPQDTPTRADDGIGQMSDSEIKLEHDFEIELEAEEKSGDSNIRQESSNVYTPPENQGYTWQNPNPYNSGYNGYGGNGNTQNGYTGYSGYNPNPPKPKKPKRKLSGTEIALICVGGISVLLLIALIVTVTIAMVSKYSYVNSNDRNDVQNEQQFLPDNDSESNDDSNTTQRPTEDLPTLETQEPTTDQLTIPEIYQKVKDSVVGITVTVTGSTGITQGSGTGIVLSEDGYISTNAHVVDGASSIQVVLTDETEYAAELIGIDTRTDLAVLKINKTGLQPAEFGDSDSLQVGETVVAIGNPYGLELAGTVTSGIVSAVDRQIVIDTFYMTLIQTDASINPGNSGGPLVNSYGQVVGVTSSKIVSSGYEGIGFAIPMSTATTIIQDLIQYGYIKDRPYIGITGYDIDAASASMYSLPQGVRIESVDPESDAYNQGLKRGDIIIAVDGVTIESMADLEIEKNKKKPGDSITLTVYRNTKEIDITITLSESTAE